MQNLQWNGLKWAQLSFVGAVKLGPDILNKLQKN